MNSINKNTRVDWIDIIKGISMIFVIMSHSGAPKIYGYIYIPIFLSSFFFVSGYTFNPRNTFMDFFLHKCKTLLVPYFFLGLVNAIISFIFDGDSLTLRIMGLLTSKKGNDALWFIMCLFVMQFLFYGIWKIDSLMEKSTTKTHYFVIFIVSIIFSLFGYYVSFVLSGNIYFQFSTSLIMIPFMSFGYIWKNVSFKDMPMKCMFLVIIIYLALVFLIKNEVDIHNDYYKSYLLFLPESFLGVYIMLYISKMLSKFTICSNILVFLGKNTLVYYAFQTKCIRILDLLCMKFGIALSSYIKSPIYSFICCIVLAFPAIIIYRFFPFVLGKTNNNQKRMN